MPSALFTPITLGSRTFPNRIVVAPMCQYSSVDGCATDWHMTHLGMLANSGAALVVVEASAVEAIGRITHGDMGLYDDACEAALKRVIDHCKRIGTAKFGIQIAHAGRKASQTKPWEGGVALGADAGAWQTIAPSALAYDKSWHTPRAMSDDDMERVLNAHAEAAKRALRIGFDELELHGAHGYLLHEFCSPLSNQRSDAYGGSLEGRLRFPIEVASAVRAVWPAHLPLGMRITASDWADGGFTPDDAVVLAQKLKDAGLDFVCVSSGGLVPQQKIPLEPGYQVPFAERIRREAGIAVRAVGLIADPHHAEAIVADGKADMVALARGFLDNPHWAWHAARALDAKVAQPDQYLRSGSQSWAKLFEAA